MSVVLVPARLLHVGPIAQRMRAVDIREAAAFGQGPKLALRHGLRGSTLALTALVDGRPEAMIGVVPLSAIESRGSPWMLGTDAVIDHARALVALAGAVLQALHGQYRILENRVSADNAAAIRLLRRWGFAVGGEAEMVGGVPFLSFRREI